MQWTSAPQQPWHVNWNHLKLHFCQLMILGFRGYKYFPTSLISDCLVAMKNIFKWYMKVIKSRSDWLLIYYFIIFQCLIKIPSAEMLFLFHPDIQLATNYTGLYLLSVKWKDKNEDIDWLKFSSSLKLSLFIPTFQILWMFKGHHEM